MSIQDLDATAPADAQDISLGALRIRETRAAIKASFPNVGDAVTATSEVMNTVFTAGSFIVGMTIDWQGDIGSIPSGFVLSDGAIHNGFQTIDLRSKFVVGYNSGDGDYDIIGKSGGSKTKDVPVPLHNHSASFAGNALGNHSHSFPYYTGGGNGGNYIKQSESASDGKTMTVSGASAGVPSGSVTVNHAGSGTQLDVRAPYTVLAKIVYVGIEVV